MKEKIFTICENLSKVGINPTAERVRTELGGGSFTKITPIIKEWRESQKKIEPVPEIPPEALKAVHQATALIWSIANDHQIEAINAVKQEYSRSEQEAIAEKEEALKEVAFLEEKLNTQDEHLKALQSQTQEKAQEANTLLLEIEKQKLTIANITEANSELKTELKAVKQRAETKERENNEERGTTEIYLNKLNFEIQHIKEINTELTARNTALANELETLEKEARAEKNRLEQQIYKQQLALDTITTTNKELKAEITEQRKQTDIAKNEASKLEGMLESYRRKEKEEKAEIKAEKPEGVKPETLELLEPTERTEEPAKKPTPKNALVRRTAKTPPKQKDE